MNLSQYIKYLEHHAYFIHSFKDVVDKLKYFLKDKFNIDHSQNPDFYHEKFETFGINESRALKDRHSSKGYREDLKRIFIIEISNITHEAQNALLKIFEEPHENSHFFIVMPSAELLLPTLRSRLFILPREMEIQDYENDKEIKDFLKLSRKEKIDYVDDIAKRISDEEIDKSYAINFLNNLSIVLYQDKEKNKSSLKAIIKVLDYINDRGASVKQLLEYIALLA
jgi:DNA polymerase III delta prime subunit